ncbi:hypothetical protein [Hymenobacter baengnokdamensis]|uniref:hypothetical protein n=1 Tax=Hymenobacter baengnokdamensis TaxID=2615203 RepID=UPI0012476BED|nr:hypothetical protein [Hymenobacter baengnokdamensis]
MTEPTNPLFEEEKDFLERKKLEYERALRGDVEDIKEHTIQAGKLALVGAGVFSTVWLLRKAFGGSSRKKHDHHDRYRSAYEDYAGFDGYDENDQELDELDSDFHTSAFSRPAGQEFATDEVEGDGFYEQGRFSTDDASEDDDNGLSHQADFPAHSAAQHGSDTVDYHFGEDHGDEEGPAHSYASSNSYQARPYDDSRRLPHSDSFTEGEETAADAPPKRSLLGPTLMAFAQSETGRVIMAQAAAVALALVTKAVQDIMPRHEAETGENADLAASSATMGTPPATWPATSAAQDAAAAARHDDNLPYREPLA